MSKNLTQEQLKSILRYEPETGLFTWIVGSGPVKAGAQAGTRTADGYLIVMIGGRNYRAARLAWLYMTGRWPEKFVDHRNRNKSDDRFDNLREADEPENAQNHSKHRDAEPWPVGVYWNVKRKQFQAKICKNYKQLHLGWFDNVVDAFAARIRAEREMFTHGPMCQGGA